jgi:predicted Zn finger-like uncharacterized protein
MRISCPSCQSSYKIADEKVQGRTVKVRCRKCGLTIHVNEQGVMNQEGGGAAPEPPAGGAEPGGVPQFSVLVAEGDQRDMGLQEIVAAYNSGVVTADTFVWAEGQPDWMPLGEIPAVVDALNAASEAVDKAATTGESEAQAPAPVEQPAAAPAPEPIAAAPAPEPMAMAPAPEPMAMAPAPMAAPEPAPEPSPAPAPLFGAEPSPAPAAAAPSPLFGGSSAAAVQVSHENKADLFSAQAMAGADDDVATSAPQMAPPAAGAATGARDESSVLFSLSALTAATASTSGGDQGASGGDDSGLIDLRALADKDAGGAPEAAPAMPTAGILDSAPLLGTPIVDPNLHQLKASEPPAAKKNMGMIIGIAIGAVGILTALVAVVVVLTREPPAPPPPATVTVTVPAETAPPVPTPADTGSSAAAAPATGAASAPPTPTKTYTGGGKTGGGKTGGGKTGGGKTGGATTGGGATPKPPPTKKPPANKCNCPPGDLACNMACAVK